MLEQCEKLIIQILDSKIMHRQIIQKFDGFERYRAVFAAFSSPDVISLHMTTKFAF
jgi:hypothetical protein